MIKQWRRRLFYSLTVVFILLGAGAVFYAQGWRLDIKSFAAKKVGAIYVRSLPKEAGIYLNGKPVKNKSGFFQSGTLINDLFPKTYKLKLSLPNYYDWQRTITVQPSLVSEAKYAVLVPVEPAVVFAEPIKNFWIINEEILLQRNDNDLVFRNQTLKGDEVIEWAKNPQSVLTKDSKNKTYIWNDLENNTSTNLSIIFRRSGPATVTLNANFILYPETGFKLLLVSSSSVLSFDIKKSLISTISTSTFHIAEASPSRAWIAWATFDAKKNISQLNLYDLLSEAVKNNQKPLPGRTIKLAWTEENQLGILQNDGGFYMYDAATDKLSSTASDVKNFVFTDDGSAVAALENRSLEVFSLKTEDYWRFNLLEAERVSNIVWYKDRHHLFLIYPDRIKFLDLDDLSQENVTTVAETPNAAYDLKANRLYFLEDGKLMRLDFPS